MTPVDRNLYAIIIGIAIVIIVMLYNSNRFLRWRLKRQNEDDKIRQLIYSEECSLNAYMWTDVDGKLLGINKVSIEMFGWQEKDLKGKGLDIIILPEYLEIFDEYKRNYPEGGYGNKTIVVEALTKAKERKFIEILLGKWSFNLEWYYKIVLHDISQTRITEEQLIKNQDELISKGKLYHEGEKIGFVAFWKLDCKTGILTGTPNYSHMMGMKGVEIQIDRLIKLIAAEYKIKFADTLNEAKKEKRGYTITYKANGLDGFVKTIESIAVAYKDSAGELDYYIGMDRLTETEKKWD